MTRYNVKFIVYNQIPTSQAQADQLSQDVSLNWSSNGWALVSMAPIPGSPGLLLTLQKPLES